MKTNEQIINEINIAFGLKTDTELAKELGIKPQTVSNWKTKQNITVGNLKKRFPNINANYILSNGKEGTLLIESSADRLFQTFNALRLDLDTIYRKTDIANGYFDNLQNIDNDKIDVITKVFPRINKEFVMHGKGIMLNPSPSQDVVNEPSAEYGTSLPKAIQLEIKEKINKMDEAMTDFKNIMRKYNIATV